MNGNSCLVSSAVLLMLAALLSAIPAFAQGYAVSQVTTSSSDDIHPDWSADGKIVFSSNRSGNYDIYVVNADGSGLKRLTNDPLDEVFPSWSADGTKIVYVKGWFYGGSWFWQSDVNSGEIWIMDADGSNQVKIADGISSPVFSPSDSEIAFVNWDVFQHVYVYNLTTGVTKDVTPVGELNPYGAIFRLSWGSGNRIAYDRFPEGIQTFDPDGSNYNQLYVDAVNEGPVNPDWSADGSKIAFSSHLWRNGHFENNIGVLDVATGKVVTLENTSSIDAYPSWSYDGRIAFVSDRSGNNDIWVIELGSCIANVTMSGPKTVTPNQQFEVTISVSNVSRLVGFNLFLNYTPSLKYEGYDLSSDVGGFSLNYDKKVDNGTVEIAAVTLSPSSGYVTGDVELLRVYFNATSEGVMRISFGNGSTLKEYTTAVVDMPGVCFNGIEIEAVNSSSISGDMNNDGKVNFNDLIAVLNIILSNQYNPAADLNHDGKVNFNDLIAVLNIILAG